MQDIKEQIATLAAQLGELASSDKNNAAYIDGVCQANAAFANEILAAYHRSEAFLALLIRSN